jgi:hypothetical protein
MFFFSPRRHETIKIHEEYIKLFSSDLFSFETIGAERVKEKGYSKTFNPPEIPSYCRASYISGLVCAEGVNPGAGH